MLITKYWTSSVQPFASLMENYQDLLQEDILPIEKVQKLSTSKKVNEQLQKC